MAASTPVIQTVTGDVEPPADGFVLAHEHLDVHREVVRTHFAHAYDAAVERRETMIALAEARAVGLRLLCDPTPPGMGRDARLLADVATASGVPVVAATGLFTFDTLDPYFASRSADAMAELFVRDLTVGMQGTPYKAGLLKCATDEPGVTANVDKVLRAVARAHRATGFPIMTHATVVNDSALRQIAVFAEEGVDLAHVVIGHLGDSMDTGLIRRVLDAGAFVGLDRFGHDDRLPLAARFDVLAELCRAGYRDRIIVSHDYQCGGRSDRFPDAADLAARRPCWALTLLPKALPGELARRGIEVDTVNVLLRQNPLRWLGRAVPY